MGVLVAFPGSSEGPQADDPARLRGENAELRAENGELRAENGRLKGRVRELEGKVEELRRAAKRQAAPFSRGEPKSRPRRSGRKPGGEYGRRAHRPAPRQVDEVLTALLPDRCPCGGEIEFERIAHQYQTELPEPRPIYRRYEVHIGHCRKCNRRHRGRHPDQTSDALGAAASGLGPRAVALAAQLNKEHGLSPKKTAATPTELGIQVTPGGIVQAIARTARTLEPTYDALIEGIRQSPVVAPDETGWRVGGARQWLWAFAGAEITVYLIAPGRGYEQACLVLGPDFCGVLERDGWAPYRRLCEAAAHQSCLAHLLRRTSEMIADSRAGQARIPHAVRRLLLDALALRQRFASELGPEAGGEVIEGTAVETTAPSDPLAELVAGERLALPASRESQPADLADAEATASEHSERAGSPGEPSGATERLRLARSELEGRLDELLARNPTHAPNRRLLAHLRVERDHLFTFLKTPGVEATNWRAEQAIRPAVVNRKSWGGNRSWAGAETQQVVMSVIRTARQQGLDPLELIVAAARRHEPAVSEALRIPGKRPRASPPAALAA